jgi:hypothetical protein
MADAGWFVARRRWECCYQEVRLVKVSIVIVRNCGLPLSRHVSLSAMVREWGVRGEECDVRWIGHPSVEGRPAMTGEPQA